MTDKVTTVADAVARLVNDGDYLAIGGFGSDRLPTAVVHEILRQGKQRLGFAGHTATHDFQVLCAGNLIGRGTDPRPRRCRLRRRPGGAGLSPHARRVMESGEVTCTEWTNYTLAVRFKAAAMGVPFLPARSLLGTDTFRHSAARVITCPFTGEKLAAPAGPLPRRGRHSRPRGRPLRQLPHPRHHRRRPRPGPRGQASDRHLRTPHPKRRRSAATRRGPSFRFFASTPCARCRTAVIRGTCRTSISPTRPISAHG